ncbi:hypothetical protein [Filimonas lacunae]|uniref:hypothetical protein n=1 Tax=Filimonas lacunae TaxID=477680 RepID=UPI00135630E8|nr:hypothetical protein [Filimonas lacunae]
MSPLFTFRAFIRTHESLSKTDESSGRTHETPILWEQTPGVTHEGAGRWDE